jgi:type III secretion protein Q
MPTQTVEAVTELGQAVSLPRADPANVRALNKLYKNLNPCDVSVRDLAYRVVWHGDADAANWVHDSYRFKLGAHTGHLGLDAPSVAALLSERRTDLLPADLRYILLADAVHSVADAIEKSLRLHFEWQPAEGPARERTVFHFNPERAGFFKAIAIDGSVTLRGFVQFEDAATLDTLLPPSSGSGSSPMPPAFDSLRLPLSFLIGSTPIVLREIRNIRRGDIISIEQWRSSGSGIEVTADLGGGAGRSLTGIADGSLITIQQPRDSAMKPETPTHPPSSAESSHLPIDRLDALEVNLRFEVGDLSLSLGELKSIHAGHVFDLGQPLNRTTVRILAHGNVLGKGYLVAVGDRLGVRVSDFAPGEV